MGPQMFLSKPTKTKAVQCNQNSELQNDPLESKGMQQLTSHNRLPIFLKRENWNLDIIRKIKTFFSEMDPRFLSLHHHTFFKGIPLH